MAPPPIVFPAVVALLADRSAAQTARETETSMPGWAAYFGDHELALQMHRRFLEQGQGSLVEGFVLNVPQPIFDGMRRLEGFKNLVADVGLVEYWRATGHWSDYCRPVDADQLECF